MKKLLSIILFLLLASPGWGATYYVSQTATNGYQIGVDTNNGTSKSTPWLTVDKANTTITHGDTIYFNDGTYNCATYLNITKNSTWLPENAGQVTIQSTTPNATWLVNFNAASSQDLTVTIGAINFNAANSSLYAMSVSADAYVFNLTFNGTKWTNPTQSFLNASSTKANLAFNDVVGEGSAITRTGISAVALAQGSVVIDGFTTTQTGNNTAGTGAVAIKATATGVTASVKGVTGTITLNTGLTGTGAHTGIQIYNIANAVIEDCDLTIGANPGSRTAILYWISADPTTAVDSSGGIIRNNIGVNNTNGGMLALIGQDSSSAAAASHDQANNGSIYGNTLSGTANSNATLHGAAIGNQTGGQIYGNLIDNVNIGILAKGMTNGVMHHNIITRSTGSYLRAKASAGTGFYNNTCIGSTSYMYYGLLADEDTVTSVYSSDVVFSNNVMYTSATPSQKLAQVSAGNTGTFSNNLYYSSASLPASPFTYQSTNYDTFAAWQTAQEATAVYADPKFKSASDYRLLSSSPCRNAGSNTVWFGTANVTDFSGRKITDSNGYVIAPRR